MNEFVLPLRVYIEDSDYAGIVYHANYLKFFERARSEWAEILGFGMLWQQELQIYFPIRAIEINFYKPARINDQVEIVTKLKRIGHASLIYWQCLRDTKSRDTILCEAKTKVACTNYSMKPCPLPKLVKNLFNGDLPCDV